MKSETSTNAPTNSAFSEIYLWVDKAPLSRPKKSMARDFCDCVCLAELVKFYQPKLIDVHNYPPSSNVKQKFTNWATFNKKILSRLNMSLSQEQISDLVNAKPGKIEQFLIALRPKLEAYRHEPVLLGSPVPSQKSRPMGYSEINCLNEKENQRNMQSHEQYPMSQPMQYMYSEHRPVVQYAPEPPVQYHQYELLLAGRDSEIQMLRENLQMLSLKVSKLEELIAIKDRKIEQLSGKAHVH